jgi:hypothetical protein
LELMPGACLTHPLAVFKNEGPERCHVSPIMMSGLADIALMHKMYIMVFVAPFMKSL